METLPAILQTAFENRARDDVLVERVDGVWTPTSTAMLRARIARVASSLHASGLRPGDRIALLAPNRIDWVVADLGILFAGCVVVPIFATQALDQVGFILNHSESAMLFVDTPVRRNVLRERAGIRIPIVAFDDETEEGMAAFEAR